MMYRTELLEEITVENATVKNQCQNRGNGKGKLSPCHNVILGKPKGLVLVFSKRD